MLAGRLIRFVLGTVGFAIFLAMLELAAWSSGVSEASFPRASTIVKRTVLVLGDSSFRGAVADTLRAAAVGFAIACVIAIPCGIILAQSRRLFRALRVVLELLRPIPAIALIPPALLVLGAGTKMKVSLIAYAVSWILLYNTLYAVHDVDTTLRLTADVYRLGRLRKARSVILPAALPFILTGVRIAATAAFLVAVAVELIAGGTNGLGQWLGTYRDSGSHRDYVFAGAFVAGFIGLGLNVGLSALETKLFPWRASVEGRSTE
ncbi:MAG: NitT/TauT family transport system permease protein [Acidimicrobiaceae bacterium]|jgi:NitT/TauT family transport system permease protein|nr:NitT/TauT family transport system permease protein [Acidimicrobiaceae bacterium]